MKDKSKEESEAFLLQVMEHILEISTGQCSISEIEISKSPSALERDVLGGLLVLHEDLELYKVELRRAMESKYRLKIIEARNAELEQFNYAASHDLQEPIRTIRNFAKLLKTDFEKSLNPKWSKYIDIIDESSERMQDLVSDLLSFSILGLDKELEQIDCNQLLNELLLDLATSIEAKQAMITIGKLHPIKAYKTELRILFQNLISNALKFSKDGQAPRIFIENKKDQKTVVFEVRDNGIGISPEFGNKIFEVFQRLHDKSVYPGTGIGLALCKKILELHQGEIWMDSQIGEGTSFYFAIPSN